MLVAANGLRIRDNVRRSLPPRHSTIDPFLQTLNNWLVKPLPKGSALTAIFDSCTSGTLLGNAPSVPPLPAIAYAQKDLDHYKCNNVYRPWVNKGGRKSNTLRNQVGRLSSYLHHRSSSYPLVQSGRTASVLALGPQADAAPHFGRAAAKQRSIFPAFSRSYSRWTSVKPLNWGNWPGSLTNTMGKGVRLQNASLYARGGVAIRYRRGRPLIILMLCVGFFNHLPIPSHLLPWFS